MGSVHLDSPDHPPGRALRYNGRPSSPHLSWRGI